jgi:hypothetical protein
MTYKPEFSRRDRNGKISLWVKMPDGDIWNIWDLPKGISRDGELALMHSFELGFRAAISMCAPLEIFISPDATFKE